MNNLHSTTGYPFAFHSKKLSLIPPKGLPGIPAVHTQAEPDKAGQHTAEEELDKVELEGEVLDIVGVVDTVAAAAGTAEEEQNIAAVRMSEEPCTVQEPVPCQERD